MYGWQDADVISNETRQRMYKTNQAIVQLAWYYTQIRITGYMPGVFLSVYMLCKMADSKFSKKIVHN